MIAVTIGTTSWRATASLAAGEVEYNGEILYASDGVTPLMVWDAGLNNMRVMTSAEQLDVMRAAAISSINAECRRRLVARYGGAEEQVSRSIGVYGDAERDSMLAGISATIDASNVASNAVIAATTAQEVEAVTVTWPAI